MNILEQIKSKAKALGKTIVLCEGEDSRVVRAAAMTTKEGVAKIVLLGNEAEIKAKNPDVDLTGVEIVDAPHKRVQKALRIHTSIPA